ncbi:Putative flavin monooxygenase, FAD/NAD(P)-binding domain superfamily [Septoria linicola]|uniref:Flavin monooxygenase, FAD/NAD(P)-binding domain superfamily n=1 Tax=Septoria linicola TaxID=215465 RepID=A0A9Q9AU51_9PEZI|nr:putative flavin monooxygenase, FAD/NAD(P)-binding domain superfamily [Septoria linicola]USW52570.1 Putative flavin monooxygenase, FAD/NAD(P)-binding domain superfamily [Septoria linicola]
MAPPARVAVIGGGPLGLTALKRFVEDGFDVTLYEGRSWVGGLWKPDTDEALSALKTTKFNSSKYRSAITDFPMPEDMDDFPSAPQLYKYFNDYVEHFDLWPHIRLNTKAVELARSGDQWALTVVKNGEAKIVHFDKVALATGPFTKAKFPKFDGIELFQGPADHCVNFHDPSKYNGQRVLVVGLHASAQDTVSALSGHAAKTYTAHRSGLTLMPRYSADGSVYDKMPPLNFQLFLFYLSAWAPAIFTWVMDTLLSSISKKAYPKQPASWGLSPAPSLAVTTPLIASEIWPHLQSGLCEPCSAVKRFTGPKRVELTDGRILEDIDSIIYCTGYTPTIPMRLPDDVNPYPVSDEPSVWYRHMYPIHPDEKIRNSLALCGHGAFALPGFCQFEMQASATSQTWQGKSTLPPLKVMERWHTDYTAWRTATAKKYHARSTFYPFFVPMTDYAVWLDQTAGIGIKAHFGFVERWTNWCAWKLWWDDRKLYYACLNGLASPAIYALFDMGKRKPWKGAREQIFADNATVKRQQERRQELIRKEGKNE